MPSCGALHADLRWQRELLLDVCRRLVVGCEDTLWADAFPAALAMTKALEVRHFHAMHETCVRMHGVHN